MEYLYVAVSRILTSAFTERLLQLNMILNKSLFLFESTVLRPVRPAKTLKKIHFVKFCDVIENFPKSEVSFRDFDESKEKLFRQKWPASPASS